MVSKKDILVFNIKYSPLVIKVTKIEDFYLCEKDILNTMLIEA